jgi:hypothetical protein
MRLRQLTFVYLQLLHAPPGRWNDRAYGLRAEDHPQRNARNARLRPTDLLLDYGCSYSTAINGYRWPDDFRVSDIETLFTCNALRQEMRRRPT